MNTLSDLEKEWVRFQIDRFLTEVDSRLDRLAQLISCDRLPPVSEPPVKPPESVLHPVEDTEISIRAFNVLHNYGIAHMEQLTQVTPRQLAGFNNCGRRTVNEIRAELAKLGLSLKDDGYRSPGMGRNPDHVGTEPE